MIEGCPWARKIVDDTIIWAEDRQQLERRIRQVPENCRRLNITISKKKFEIGEEIKFAGHIISKNGISPDKSKYDAIPKFQTPSYAVVQEAGEDKLHLIECGSSSLKPTQQNYATIEIE